MASAAMACGPGDSKVSISKIAVIGTGTMGQALSAGMLREGVVLPQQLVGTVKHEREAETVRARVDFEIGTDNALAAAGADVILLCTKPKQAGMVISELAEGGALDGSPMIVSIAAGVSTGELEQVASGLDLRVVRAMPNTPCLIGEGMVVLSPGKFADESDLDVAETLFRPLARVLRLDEEHMDAVTGLSGSGPAFIYVIIEALSEGGVMAGLPRRVATELAAQTALGASKMVLDTGRHPASLKDDVTTPAGCTISALLSLEDGRLRSVLARGVQEAARTAAGLGGGRGSAS